MLPVINREVLSKSDSIPSTYLISARIREILKKHRQSTAKVDDGPVHSVAIPDPRQGRHGIRGIIGIPTRGCSYARTQWGGCSVCGHILSSLWDPDVDCESVVADIENSIMEISSVQPPLICLYTSGSFLDDSELHPGLRRDIISRVVRLPWVRSIVIESLPQFVTSSRIDTLLESLGDIRLTVSMGVDSFNSFVRSFVFQRHIHESSYRVALATCKERGVSTSAYIVHKPPLLTDGEAVADTAHSLKKAFALGFSSVSIEPTALQEGTLQHVLYSQGLYRPPTIWTLGSALHAYRSLTNNWEHDFGRISIGGQAFTPLPQATLKGCVDCLNKLMNKICLSPTLFRELPIGPHSSDCGTAGLIQPSMLEVGAFLERTAELLNRAW